MFQVITPQVGDKLYFNAAAGVSPYFVPAIIRKTSVRKAKAYGLPPLERGRDKFGNRSCFHLNFKGSLYVASVAGTSRVSLGFAYYEPSLTLLTHIGYGIKFPNFATPISGFIEVGVNHKVTIPTYYVKYSSAYTLKYVKSIRYIWISSTRLRVEIKSVSTRMDTGVDVSASIGVYYYQYNWRTSPARMRSYYKSYSIDAIIPSWVYPTSSFSSITSNHTVIGLDNTPTIKMVDFHHRLSKVLKEIPQNDSSSFGQLTLDAAQGLRVIKVNIFSYLIELEWITKLDDYVKTLSKVNTFLRKNLKINAKTVSSAYLSSKYGIKLTYLDTVELFGQLRSSVGMSKDRWTSSRARTNLQSVVHLSGKIIPVATQYNMKLYCERHSSDFIAAWAQLLVSGFYPLTESAWDNVPFSFVIDWFTRFNKVLQVIDAKTIYNSYNITSTVYSARSVFHVPISDIFPEWADRLIGDLEVVYYRRYVSKKPPPIHLNYQTPTSFTHWVEGAALIVQRL